MSTLESSSLSLPASPQPPALADPGPLSWVMPEIREALARSRTALIEAGGRAPEDQSTRLLHAKTHLHQAHGALLMLDIAGVSQITALAESALDGFKSGAVKCSADLVQAVAQLYQALIAYLEELLAGAPAQPVGVFADNPPQKVNLGAAR
ncbi:MAG: Hpt domain-containing protein, partial [Duganella sp.]